VATENARANLTALDEGHVDLAVLYETDLRLRPSLRAIHRPAATDHPPIRYVIARASGAPACPSIERVLEGWQTPGTQRLLILAGFDLPTHSAALGPATHSDDS
jgi:molybdate transport system substrate-binding protein